MNFPWGSLKETVLPKIVRKVQKAPYGGLHKIEPNQ